MNVSVVISKSSHVPGRNSTDQERSTKSHEISQTKTFRVGSCGFVARTFSCPTLSLSVSTDHLRFPMAKAWSRSSGKLKLVPLTINSSDCEAGDVNIAVYITRALDRARPPQ